MHFQKLLRVAAKKCFLQRIPLRLVFDSDLQVYLSSTNVTQEKNGSNQSFDFIKDFTSVKSLCD